MPQELKQGSFVPDNEDEKSPKERVKKAKKKALVEKGDNHQSRKMREYWMDQIESVNKLQGRWIKKSNAILKRFRDERKKIDEEGARRMNVLWANVKILKPAIFSRLPVPNVDRWFLDKDNVGRLSSIILERNLRYEVANNQLYNNVSRAVLDYLLPGRGVVWVRYEPEIGESISIPASLGSNYDDELDEIEDNQETEEEEKLEETGEQLIAESVPVDYIDFKDFGMIPAKARTWAEVKAVYKRVYMSKHEAKERFGEELAKFMKPDATPMGLDNQRRSYSDSAIFQDINERSIVVYEIWNKNDRTVYWISTGCEFCVDVRLDPLKLKRFFPVPEPLSSTLTNDTMVPVPDFEEYQDQAIQIDELTQRIALLVKACRVAGTYDGSNGAIKRVLDETVENQLIPVDNWAMFAEKGGIAGGMSFLPLDQIQATIDTLIKVRSLAMQDMDMITGVSDIIRGTSDSRETLGGIRLKNNNAGTRLTDRQEEVTRFVRDVINIVAEIQCKHYQDETLIEASNIMFADELQPETILEDIQQKMQPAMPMAPPQQQQQQLPLPQGTNPALQHPPMLQPGQQPMPQQMPPRAMPGAPMAMPQQMQQQPGNNIIPFPMMSPEMMVQQVIQTKISKALELLRKDIPRGYRIEIETDSTIFGDKQQDREDVTNFATAITGFLQQAETVGAALPEAAPLMGKMMEFFVRRFRAGRDLEQAVNTFVDSVNKRVKAMQKNPPPDKDMMKLQADLQRDREKHQADLQKSQYDFQLQQQNDQRDAAKQVAEDQRTAQLAQLDAQNKAKEDARQAQLSQAEDSRKERMASLELSIKEREAQIRFEEMEREAVYKRQEHEQKMLELAEKAKERKAKAAERKKKKATTNA